MDNTLLHYKTYDAFKKDLYAGLIKNQSVAYIRDKRIIYTHGAEYNGSIFGSAEVDTITTEDLAQMGITA